MLMTKGSVSEEFDKRVMQTGSDGEGFAGGDSVVSTFENGAHGAEMNEEGLELVFVPVVGGDVDFSADFDVWGHAVGGGGVAGVEVGGVLAVLGWKGV